MSISIYGSLLYKNMSSDDWDRTKLEISQLVTFLTEYRSYYRWALHDSNRLMRLSSLFSSTLMQKLFRLWVKEKKIKFLFDLNEWIDQKRNEVSLCLPLNKPLSDSCHQKLTKLAQLYWDEKPIIQRYDKSILMGGKLVYKNQVYDATDRAYRHNLIVRIRKAQKEGM